MTCPQSSSLPCHVTEQSATNPCPSTTWSEPTDLCETRVSLSLQKQQDLTDQIQRTNSEFNQARASLIHGGASREQKMKQLATAYDIFTELKSNSEEGVRFYNDLAQMLVRFQGKVTDFCVARKAEKDEHMRDLTLGSSWGYDTSA